MRGNGSNMGGDDSDNDCCLERVGQEEALIVARILGV